MRQSRCCGTCEERRAEEDGKRKDLHPGHGGPGEGTKPIANVKIVGAARPVVAEILADLAQGGFQFSKRIAGELW